ncbi:hypothetical protein WMF30_18680 [Sorangium sp. So ce134]
MDTPIPCSVALDLRIDAARPWAGNKANPQTGSAQSPLTVSGHHDYVKLPTNYDASKPYPVMIMFSPTNDSISWAEQNAGFEATANDVSFSQPFYDQITDDFCIDKAPRTPAPQRISDGPAGSHECYLQGSSGEVLSGRLTACRLAR